jgi:hypothetical protein
MPYVRCQNCGLPAYSAAAWSGTDHCGSCDAPLPRPDRDPARAGSGIGAPRAALPSRRDSRERRWSDSVLGEALRELGRH